MALLAGCTGAEPAPPSTGETSETTATTITVPAVEPPAAPTVPVDEQPGPAETTTTTSPPTTTTTTSPPTTTTSTTLPGERVELLYGPEAGDVLTVVGVSHDEPPALLDVPGGGAVLATLDPLATGIVATGRSRQVDGVAWHEVQVEPHVGWVQASQLAYLGPTDDFATVVVVYHGGNIPTAASLSDLGSQVLRAAVPEGGGEVTPRVVMSAAPTVGDVGEMSFDVVGLADDSIFGFRLHVFAYVGDGPDPFTLKSVERTLFCARGRSGDFCT